MKIRYLREVYSPPVMAGAPWSERDLPENMAQQLIREGYAEKVIEPAPRPSPKPRPTKATSRARKDDPTDVAGEQDAT